jgi:hypothetical protein
MSAGLSAHRVECRGCGNDLAGYPDGVACRECGETRRHHFITVHESVTVSDSLSLGIEYVSGRPWHEMWARVGRRLADVQSCYGTPGKSVDEARDAASEFFVWAYQLKDWLKNDPQVPTTTQAKVEPFVQASAALKLCGDFANTDKHHTRKPGQRTAWIGGATAGDSQPVTLRIDFVEPNGTKGSRDALQLAEAAKLEWDTFLTAEGLA